MRGCLRISVPLSSNAPCELVDEETIVWRDVVEAMPADHFIPANYHLLVQYCRHVVEARRIEQTIKEYRDLRKAKAGRSEFNYSTFFALQEANLSQIANGLYVVARDASYPTSELPAEPASSKTQSACQC